MIVGFTIPAAAQDAAKLDVSGGYQLLSAKSAGETEWTNFPKGWYVDVAGNVNKTIAIVGEVGGNYKTETNLGTSVDFKVHPFMGGVRASFGRTPTLVPFGQVLVGGVNLRASSGAVSVSETDLGFQVGGGVNLMLDKKIGARVGADYLRIVGKSGGPLSGNQGTNVFRFVVGVLFSVGGTK